MCYKRGKLVRNSFNEAAQNASPEWSVDINEGYNVPLTPQWVGALIEQNDGRALEDGQEVRFPTYDFRRNADDKVVDFGQLYTVEGCRRHAASLQALIPPRHEHKFAA